VIDALDIDLDVDTLDDRLLYAPFPVERSVCCEWWFACSDLAFDEARNGGVCAACEPHFEP
jgi:hypothetical protein